MATGRPFDANVFDELIFDVQSPNIDENETTWVAEVLHPMGPRLKNEYKRYKFIDRFGNVYHLPKDAILDDY